MKIDNLISECTTYDYKEMLEEKKPKSWLKSISAFANGLEVLYSLVLTTMES